MFELKAHIDIVYKTSSSVILKTIWKILDYFFLLRPTLFFPLWTVVLAGRFNAIQSSEVFMSGELSGAVFPPLILIFAAFGALMGASYTINQLVDSEGDKTNRKLFLVADKYVRRSLAVWFSTLLAVLGTAGLFSLGFSAGILGLTFIIITGLFYNIQPFRWKDKPVLGALVSVFGGAVAFFLGSMPLFDLEMMMNSIPYLAAFSAVSILTTVPDMEGDKAAGKTTFALYFGLKATLAVSMILCIFAAAAGFFTQDPVIFWPALLSAPIFILTFLHQGRESVVLAVKFSIFILSLAVGFRFPAYLILMAVYFLFGRWYYRSRFDMTYPSFRLE